MKTPKLLTAISVLGLVVAPVGAAASPLDRSSSSVSEAENLGGAGALGWIIALAVAIGIALVISNDDEDYPTSP